MNHERKDALSVEHRQGILDKKDPERLFHGKGVATMSSSGEMGIIDCNV